IHMSPLDALILKVSHGDRVSVAIEGDERGLIFNNVAIRVSPDMRLEMHIDTDEANAAGADNPQAFARLVGPR
ncbi:PduL/EutD family phosphate acyltransferase, partial [Salmonella enterica]